MDKMKEFAKEFFKQIYNMVLLCGVAIILGTALGYGFFKSAFILNAMEDKFLVISFLDKPAVKTDTL